MSEKKVYGPSVSSLIRIAILCSLITIALLVTIKIIDNNKRDHPRVPVATNIDQAETEVKPEPSRNLIAMATPSKQVENTQAEVPAIPVPTVEATPVLTPAATTLATPTPIVEEATPTPTSSPTPVEEKAEPTPEKDPIEKSKSFQKVKKIIADYNIPNLDSEELAEIITQESEKYKIDPLLTTAIIYLESTFNRYAESENGKVGLMQIYPDDAKVITKELKLTYLGNVTLFHPVYNIKLGLFKLRKLIDESDGKISDGIKKYSTTNSAKRLEIDLLDEEYLKRVMEIYNQYSS